MSKTQQATLAAILGNGIFGFSFMFSRMALDVASPFVMLMYRFCIAFAAINLVALWASRRRKNKAEDWLRFSMKGKDVRPLIALGAVQPVTYFLCESYGISLTNSVLSGVIIAMIPIAALAFGVLFLGEIPRRAQVGYSALSIGGVIAMTLQQSSGGDIHPVGVVLLFGAVVSDVFFSIISRKTARDFSALERTYVMMLMAAIVFTALAVMECRNTLWLLLAPMKDGRFMLSMLYLSLASSIMAFLSLNFANGELPVGKVTAFCNLTTVISVFAGVVFLGEPFTVLSLIASVVIVVGVWGVQKA